MLNSVAISPLANILINPMDLVTASPNALVQRVLTRIRSTLNPVVGVVRVVVALPVLSMWFLLAGCQTEDQFVAPRRAAWPPILRFLRYSHFY
jgi:hypothetical protein